MASTPSPLLRLELQADGENLNTWGQKLNTLFQLVEQAIHSGAEIDIPVNANVTLTSTNYVANQERRAVLRFTGTGGFTVTFSGKARKYLVVNDCSGAVTLSDGGTTVSLEAGERDIAITDGTDFELMGFSTLNTQLANYLLKTGGTMTGKITLDGAPTSDLHASTKKYVDDSLMGITASSELPGQSANAGKYLTTNGTVASWYDLDAELATTFQPLDADLTAIAGLGTQSYGRNSLIWNETTTSGSVSPAAIWTEYLVDTGTAARSFALPAGTDGARIRIKDKDGNAAVNNITVTPNGAETIMGETSLEIDINWFAGEFRYRASNTRWELV